MEDDNWKEEGKAGSRDIMKTLGVPRVSNAPTAERTARSLCSHINIVRSGPQRVSPKVQSIPVPPTNREYCTMRNHYRGREEVNQREMKVVHI